MSVEMFNLLKVVYFTFNFNECIHLAFIELINFLPHLFCTVANIEFYLYCVNAFECMYNYV